MKQLLTVFMMTLFMMFSVAYGQRYTISGHVTDKTSGEELIGATVYIKEYNAGVISNGYGFYSLSVPSGKYKVEYSYLGYDTEQIEVNLTGNKTLNVSLSEIVQEISELVITGEKKNKNVESIQMSSEKMQVKMVKKLPSFMGEVDIMKTIQLLPGIQSGGEGSSGLYVRGGGPDENLVILDEAPVYNASHLLGFFSVFNSDAIKDIQVYKGGIPSEYGGKASSVIDIRMKDGNTNQLQATGGIGSLSSRLTLEGPVIKDKWSFILSGRRTYADFVGKLLGMEALEENQLYFYDFNGKTNVRFTDKDRLFASAYTGTDYFKLGESIYMKWGNLTTTLRWNHLFSERLFSNTTLLYSEYNYNLGVPGDGADQFDWSSKIQDISIKEDFTFFLNSNNKLKFGFKSTFHHFEPGKVTADSGAYFSGEDGEGTELTHYNALEHAAYIGNEQKFSSKLTIKYGVRFSLFQHIGLGNVREYMNPERPLEEEVISVKKYNRWDLIEQYFDIEPRLAVKYSVSTNSSVKASYNRMVQNLHLITNTNSPSPLDIWLPTNKYIKPLYANQVALGYFRNFKDDAIETSIEVYYKEMDNVIDYVDGAILFLKEDIETELLTGTAYSYGVEVLLKKQEGKFTGWIGYTLSKTRKKIPEINEGKEYPSNYDRTHDISIVMNYDFNRYFTLSSSWIYATGTPTSYPTAKYLVQNNTVFYYADRNSYRIPAYHRMDVSVTYNFHRNDRKNFKQSLNLSVFNVYARRNAYSVTFRENPDNPGIVEANRLSIIGTFIPAITYNFTF